MILTNQPMLWNVVEVVVKIYKLHVCCNTSV